MLGLYLRNIVRIIKSRVISLAEHVAHSGRRKIHIGFSCGNLKKEQIGRPRIRWKGDIGSDLKK